MPRQNCHIAAFNRGRVSSRALGRVDIERLRLCAAEQTNMMPETLGAMQFRPGFQYIANTSFNMPSKGIPFIKATDDTAILEMTNSTMRVLVNDALLTRVAVEAQVTNGDFSSDAGWVTSLTGDATATIAGGYLQMNAPARGGKSIIGRLVTLGGSDSGKVHAVRVVVTRGPVTFRVGLATLDDFYVKSVTLRTGTHSLCFIPTTNFYVEFETDLRRACVIDSCLIEGAGIVSLPTPWQTANLRAIRYAQSGDVVFVACEGVRQHRIERRQFGSWSVCEYMVDDGPFTKGRTRAVRMKATGYEGNVDLDADANFFRGTHVGALFRIFNTGQVSAAGLAREDTYCDSIRVFGYTDPERTVQVDITGTWVGTLTLERSFDGKDFGFSEFSTYTMKSSAAVSFGDVAGTEMWIRIGFRPGDHTSGIAQVVISVDGGGGYGIVRVINVVDGTNAQVEVLVPLKQTEFTENWREGQWSVEQGYPTAVAFYEGRLAWFGRNNIWESVSDAYESFDEDVEGDSGPINRTIGDGPVDRIHWALPLQRLMIGTTGQEISIRSTSFDEPLTPTQFNLKDASTEGSANVDAVKFDQRGIYIARNGISIMDLTFAEGANDYSSVPLDILYPEAGGSGIIAIAAQRKPDRRIHFIRADGNALVLTFLPAENVNPFIDIVAGFSAAGPCMIEDVVVLPALGEDAVYYQTARTMQGDTRRMWERQAVKAHAIGSLDTRLVDCFAVYAGAPTTTPPNFDHLNGETVTVWADGEAMGTFLVSGGTFTLPAPKSLVIAGLAYNGRYKSAKLAYAAASGTALLQPKKIESIGVLLEDVHPLGFKYGPDFNHLDDLPLIDGEGAERNPDAVATVLDEKAVSFPGEWSTDSRLCIECVSPLPCTVVALVIEIHTEDRV